MCYYDEGAPNRDSGIPGFLGPGYRVYFGKDGERFVILLGGSAKQRQGAAIGAAQAAWGEYRRRKSGKEYGKWH